MIKKLLTVILVLGTASMLVLNFQLPEKKAKWRNTTLYDDPAKFVELETHEDEPVVAFSSSEGVVMYERKGSQLPFISSYQEYMGHKEWEKTVVDSNGTTGSYLSMENINGEIAVAYQDSFIGDEKLFYSERVNGSWSRERVDSVAGTGLGTGMYNALTHVDGEPMIFYHTSEGRQFVKADKQDGNWSRQVLDTGVGWFTSAESCGERVLVIYRGRDAQTVFKGEYDGEWSSQNITGRTDAQTDLDATNCRFKAAFNDLNTGNVLYLTENRRETVGNGDLSRVSLEHSDKPYISFYRKGNGLIFAEKTDRSWETQLVDSRPYAGQYNDLEVDEEPRIAYTQEEKVVYAEYSSQGYEKIKRVANIGSGATVVLTILVILVTWRKRILELL